LVVIPDTSAESGFPAAGSTIVQSEPFFRRVVRSPDSDLIVTSSIESASTANALSFLSASSPGVRLDSTKYR
jgi:hypothetical protein